MYVHVPWLLQPDGNAIANTHAYAKKVVNCLVDYVADAVYAGHVDPMSTVVAEASAEVCRNCSWEW